LNVVAPEAPRDGVEGTEGHVLRPRAGFGGPGCATRDALPGLRAARRTGGDDATLAGAVEAHARAGHGGAYEADGAALVERLRGLSPVQLPAVLDLAERMDAAVLRGDVEGRERARRESGVGT
jgi:hypothetical protein